MERLRRCDQTVRQWPGRFSADNKKPAEAGFS